MLSPPELPARPASRRPIPFPESLLLAVTGLIAFVVAIRAGPGSLVFLETVGKVLVFAGWLEMLRRRPHSAWWRLRYCVAFLFTWVFYTTIRRIVPAIGAPDRDALLLEWDRWLFGETPSVFTESIRGPWLDDLMSAGYLFFHVYLTCAILSSIWEPRERSRRLWNRLLTCFALGYLGYVFFPALGPWAVYPDLYPADFLEGTRWPTWLANSVVRWGTSGWDVFPSLHVLVTLVLLHHDWLHGRLRFWLFLVPGILTILATVYLRYHYAIDALAGLLAYAAIEEIFDRLENPEPGSGPGERSASLV